MALIVTPGAANADSYATLAEAEIYFTNSIYASAWDAASDSAKEWALITATRMLDAMPRAWTGSAAVAAIQALGWPRSGMLNRNDYAIAITIVPQELKNAQSEYAGQLISENLSETDSVAAKGIIEIKAASVGLKYKTDVKNADARENALLAMVPDAVIMLLVDSWLVEVADLDGNRDGIVIDNL